MAAPRVCFVCPLFVVCFAPVGGVCGGSVVLLLCVLDGVSWRVLDGVCLCLCCVFVARLFLCDRGLVFFWLRGPVIFVACMLVVTVFCWCRFW